MGGDHVIRYFAWVIGDVILGLGDRGWDIGFG